MSASPTIQGPPATATESQRLDIARTLAPVIRAIGLTRVAHGALLGFTLGAMVGTGVLVAAHVRPFDFSLRVALLSVALGVAAGVAWGVARWPRAPEAARTADLYFGLDDRLTTALELRSSSAPVAQAQSRDAARCIDGLTLGRSRGRWLQRREVGLALVAALALAGSLALGPQGRTHHVAAAHRTASTQRAHRVAANEIQKERSQLHLGLTPGQQPPRVIRKLDLALARLQHQLLKTSSMRVSLRAISATQQQLHQLARGLHPINAKAVSQLNVSLAHYLGKHSGKRPSSPTQAAASARSTLATAQALNRSAKSLAYLAPAQRAALARALATAANTTSNNTLRSSLRQAASTLANGNPRAAGAAMQRAAQSLSRSAAAQTAQSRASTAAAQLGVLKRQLTGPGANSPSGQLANLPAGSNSRPRVPGTANSLKSASGQSQGKEAALGKGQGKGSGHGVTSGRALGAGARAGRGNGRRRGGGTHTGQGTTVNSGRGTSGAHGSAGASRVPRRKAARVSASGSGSGRSGPTRRGHTATVYIPGQQGKGPEIVRNGPNGAPQSGALVPYQQVLAPYAQRAHQALDRAALPPSVQAYVRRYFNTISH